MYCNLCYQSDLVVVTNRKQMWRHRATEAVVLQPEFPCSPIQKAFQNVFFGLQHHSSFDIRSDIVSMLAAFNPLALEMDF